MNNQPNILLIVVDQMRGDCLGAAGHPDVKTPFLDTFAMNGIRFENAYSACPSCVPARAALLTGLCQEHHGRVGYQDGIDWNYDVTLAGELAKCGYYTKCIGKMHVHPQRNLMGYHDIELHNGALGYYKKPDIPYYEHQNIADDYIFEMSQKGLLNSIWNSGVECNSWISRPWMYDEEDHPTNWVTRRCIDFLRRRDRSKPFFLTASYVRPHPPFDAPQCYFDMYKDMELRKPFIGDWAENDNLERSGRIYDSPTGPIDDEMIRQAQIGYYACITHVDHQIGRLWEAIKNEGIADNTIVMFVADHGEMLCDHHRYRKAIPYQGSVQIPFIVSGPNSLVKHNGDVSNTLVELMDVMPTLIEYAGGKVPDSLDGVSLCEEIKDGNEKKTREFLHGEHTYGINSTQFIITEKDKYIWYSQTGEEQYFNLEVDPHELHNAINDEKYSGRIEMLRNELIKALQGREEGYVKDGKLIVGKKPLNFLKETY